MRRLTVLAVLVAGVTLFAAVPALAAQASTSDPTTFTDPAGDAGAAPDLTTVKVSNDDTGTYTFDVGLATPYAVAFFGIYLDTDLNPATGNPNELGADYLIFDDHAAHALYLMQWNGTDWADAPAAATVAMTIATEGTQLTVTVNRSEIGNTDGFNFVVYSFVGEGDAQQFDDAPSGTGSWQYKLKPTVTLSLGAAKASPAKAGTQWILAVAVRRSDTGSTLGPEGMLSCTGSSPSGKLVVATHAFVSEGSGQGNAAVCGFTLPKKLKNKTVHGTVTVKYNGQTFTHTFTAHVK